MYIAEDTIEKFIKEDVPYFDLTTYLLEIAEKRGRMEFICREEAVVCGTEEVLRVLGKLGCAPVNYLASGTRIHPQSTILEAEGRAEDLHKGWKVSMNILEYASGIATRTNQLLVKARKINPKIEVLTTRKIFPGTKEIAIKAVLAGGGLPHRLGLSETVLVFKQHLNLIGGKEGLLDRLSEIKSRCCEKKVIVEIEDPHDALALSRAGVDGMQFDKISPSELKKTVDLIRAENREIILLAAGGINENNVDQYAQTGVNGLVTSWVYFGKPTDIGTKIEPLV